MKTWTLYCHVHIATGRRYIGMTSQTMEKRWKNHIFAAKNSKNGRWHFPNAIRKYGPEAFSHEVLCQSWTLEFANATEERLITQYDTRNPERGFNLAKGGEHQPHGIRKNPWDDPIFRAKWLPPLIAATQTPQARANNKAALNTPESRNKRSVISKKLFTNPSVLAKASASGRKVTPEGRIRIASALSARERSPSTIVKQKVFGARLMAEADERAATATVWTCKVHGTMPINQFYRNKQGRPRFRCIRCCKGIP